MPELMCPTCVVCLACEQRNPTANGLPNPTPFVLYRCPSCDGTWNTQGPFAWSQLRCPSTPILTLTVDPAYLELIGAPPFFGPIESRRHDPTTMTTDGTIHGNGPVTVSESPAVETSETAWNGYRGPREIAY